MLWDMNSKAVSTLMRGKLAVPDYEEAKAQAEEAARAQEEEERRRMQTMQEMQRNQPRRALNPYANYSTTRDDYETNQRKAMESSYTNQNSAARTPIKNNQPKVGRNDPCPCGSGKKYKNCHGRGE